MLLDPAVDELNYVEEAEWFIRLVSEVAVVIENNMKEQKSFESISQIWEQIKKCKMQKAPLETLGLLLEDLSAACVLRLILK